MQRMSLRSSTNVRLPDDLKSRLERVAKKSGLKAADLIRMAVEDYCDRVEGEGQITISLAGSRPAKK